MYHYRNVKNEEGSIADMGDMIPKGVFNLWKSDNVDERLNVNLDKEFKTYDVTPEDVVGISDSRDGTIVNKKCPSCEKRVYYDAGEVPEMCPYCGHPFPQD